MKKSTPAQWAIRIVIYIIGLFFLALGVAFAVNSNLGVSPVTSLPYVVSLISGTALSTCVIVVYGSYIVLQILILRKEFRIINLTQIIFSSIFGYFTDFTKWLLGDFTLPTYAGQLVMLALFWFFPGLIRGAAAAAGFGADRSRLAEPGQDALEIQFIRDRKRG